MISLCFSRSIQVGMGRPPRVCLHVDVVTLKRKRFHPRVCGVDPLGKMNVAVSVCLLHLIEDFHLVREQLNLQLCISD